MVARRLDETFQFLSGAPLQRDLKRLVATLEARFQAVEIIAGSFEEAATQFEELGLSRLNDLLTPLATEAVTRLQDITQLFGATSETEVELELVQKQFLIPVDQRNTYVPTPYISIYAIGEDDTGMIAQRVSFDRETGILTVLPVLIIGSGTYEDWQLSVSPAPSAGGYSRNETDTVVADAVDAITTLLLAKAPLASPPLTGNPTAPNQLTDDNSTRLATTAWARSVATTIAAAIVEDAINEIVIPDPLVDAADVAQVRGATLGTPPHAVTTELLASASVSVALTDAANIALDWKTGFNFTVTIAGNRILNNPSNGIPGTWRTLLVTQDGVGTRTLGYGNQYVFAGVAPIIATGNAKKSRLSIYCRAINLFEVYATGLGLTA